MGELYSCPFCRELFAADEGPTCPECELPLVPLHQLPLSLDGQAEAVDEILDPPEDQTLPWLYLGRGKGVLLLLALAGIGLFTQPWVTMARPDPIGLSGYNLATTNAPWLWGGAVGWFTMIPLLLSRRTINQLHGVRAIVTLFAAMTLGEALMLLLRPPEEHGYFSIELAYAWALYASALCGVLGIVFGVRLGGSLADLRDLPLQVPAEGERPQTNLH